MAKAVYGFFVTVKVADDEQAMKTAKELRNIALQAIKADGRSTAKADVVEDLN